MFIQKVYKYKLRPTTAQQQLFRRWLGCCRFVYNLCLEHRLCHWQSAQPRYTSQRCSVCGHTDSCNRPSQAVFRCNHCGQVTHADLNASKNIRDLGRVSGSQYGQVSRALLISA